MSTSESRIGTSLPKTERSMRIVLFVPATHGFGAPFDSFEYATRIDSTPPRDSDAWFTLGQALRAQSRTAEAGAAYEGALEIQPRDYEAWAALAAVRGALDQVDEETAAYEQARWRSA